MRDCCIGINNCINLHKCVWTREGSINKMILDSLLVRTFTATSLVSLNTNLHYNLAMSEAATFGDKRWKFGALRCRMFT